MLKLLLVALAKGAVNWPPPRAPTRLLAPKLCLPPGVARGSSNAQQQRFALLYSVCVCVVRQAQCREFAFVSLRVARSLAANAHKRTRLLCVRVRVCICLCACKRVCLCARVCVRFLAFAPMQFAPLASVCAALHWSSSKQCACVQSEHWPSPLPPTPTPPQSLRNDARRTQLWGW